MTVYFISSLIKGEWTLCLLEIGILQGKHMKEPSIHYSIHVHKPWLAYKHMEDLQKSNPDIEYKIFETNLTESININDAKELDIEPFIKWWNEDTTHPQNK